MPARLRLAEAARQLSIDGEDHLKDALKVLEKELKNMERVRCLMCDGRGHSHVASKGVTRKAEVCPLRRILRRRLGRGTAQRTVLNRVIADVASGKHAAAKRGISDQGLDGKRKTGSYDHTKHLLQILEDYHTTYNRAANAKDEYA